MTPTDALPCPNLLWNAPPRPAVDSAEAERIRQEIANDPVLIEAARNYKPDAATLKELAKYDRRQLSPYLLTLVPP